MEANGYAEFLVTATIVLVAPGPAVVFTIARSLDDGPIAGIISVAGVGCGDLVYVLLVAAGLSSVLAVSPDALSAVRLLGAIFLMGLGAFAISRRTRVSIRSDPAAVNYRRIFWQGIVVQLLNPKAIVFTVSFLPQFVVPQRGGIGVQILTLGFLFELVALATGTAYSLLAGKLRAMMGRSTQLTVISRWGPGLIYIGLGATAAYKSF